MKHGTLRARSVLAGAVLAAVLASSGAARAGEAPYPARPGPRSGSPDMEAIRAEIERLQFLPEGRMLGGEDLRFDDRSRLPRKISSREAAEDVERLFALLAQGWCAWGFFRERGDFDAARRDVLEELAREPEWKPGDLASMILERLDFVQDCHLSLGGRAFCAHEDFWHDTGLAIGWEDGRFPCGDSVCTLLEVDGKDPGPFLYPSLDEEGRLVRRLGVLSASKPPPLSLKVLDGGEESHMEITLRNPAFHAREKFGEERIGGIPVVRVRSFADFQGEELRAFLETADRYRGEPYVVLDIRGNSGGNTRWPAEWIQRFTGRRPALKQVLTEMVTPASMAGRANIFASMLRTYPEKEAGWVKSELDSLLLDLAALEDGSLEPHWTPWVLPDTTPIPNPTTLIVVMDRKVASSGEALVIYLFGQVENVVFVGENTRGALTFGQTSLHRLPYSKLRFIVPIKLNLPLDMEFREGRGYFPDLWVEAPRALNHAVAAARSGTIGTGVGLPEGYFEAEFVPEVVRRRPPLGKRARILLVLGLAYGIIVAAFFVIRRARRKRQA